MPTGLHTSVRPTTADLRRRLPTILSELVQREQPVRAGVHAHLPGVLHPAVTAAAGSRRPAAAAATAAAVHARVPACLSAPVHAAAADLCTSLPAELSDVLQWEQPVLPNLPEQLRTVVRHATGSRRSGSTNLRSSLSGEISKFFFLNKIYNSKGALLFKLTIISEQLRRRFVKMHIIIIITRPRKRLKHFHK